jgi:hypothetical protein
MVEHCKQNHNVSLTLMQEYIQSSVHTTNNDELKIPQKYKIKLKTTKISLQVQRRWNCPDYLLFLTCFTIHSV